MKLGSVTKAYFSYGDVRISEIFAAARHISWDDAKMSYISNHEAFYIIILMMGCRSTLSSLERNCHNISALLSTNS